MKKLLLLALICAGNLKAQTVSPPPPPFVLDPTSTIAMLAAAQAANDQFTVWTKDNLLKAGVKLDAIAADEALEVGEMLNIKNRLDALQTQIAAIPQGLPGADGIPGPRGIPGTPGTSPTIQIGTVLSVPCSTPASVTNTGTSTAAIFNFFIPTCGTVTASGPYALAYSPNATRAGAISLSGATIKGTVYVFTSTLADPTDMNPVGVAAVCYWLDDPLMSGVPKLCEGGSPWDFAGSASPTTANPWNSATVPNGTHKITQRVARTSGLPPEIDTVSFTVTN